MADIKNLFNTYLNEKDKINVANQEQEKANNTVVEIQKILNDPKWQDFYYINSSNPNPFHIEEEIKKFLTEDFEKNFVELFNDISKEHSLKDFSEELIKLNDTELNELKEEFFNERKKMILDSLTNSKDIPVYILEDRIKKFINNQEKPNELSKNSINSIKTSLSAIAVQTQTIPQNNVSQITQTNTQNVINDPFYLPPSTVIEEPRLIRNMDALEKKEEATKEYEDAANKKVNELKLKTKELDKDLTEKTEALNEVNKQMDSVKSDMTFLKNNNIALEKENISHQKSLADMNVFKRLFSQEARDYKKSIKENQEQMKENIKNYNGSEKKLGVLKEVHKDKNKSLELSKKNQENNKKLIENYEQVKKMNKEISENTIEMKKLIPQIDSYNAKVKELTKVLSEHINAKNKTLNVTPEQEEKIEKLKEELQGFKDEHNKLKTEYEKMESEIKSATNSIKLATKSIDNIYISTKEMIKARDTSNKVTEKTKEVLAQAKGLCLNLIGMAVSIALPTLGNVIKDIGENTKNKAELHYQAWKENKANIQEMKIGLQEMKSEKKELKQQNKAIDKGGISLTI